MKVGSFTGMVVFSIRKGCGSPTGGSERGDPHGVPLLLFFCATRWRKNVPRSSSPVFLEWDEETRWGFCSSMSHVSASKG